MLQNKQEIQDWLDKYKISDYTINDDLTVDVNSDVNLFYKSINSFPIQFGVVKGDFMCSKNQLTSLKGCPREIHGNFDCSYNKLHNLEYCPNIINKDFKFQGNGTTTLEYLPEIVNGELVCGKNPIKNIKPILNSDINSFSHFSHKEEDCIPGYEDFYEILINHQNDIEGWYLELNSIFITKMRLQKQLSDELVNNLQVSKKIKL